MADATWKAVERKVASLFGGIRTPLSGSNSKHNTQGDVICGDSTRGKNPDPPHLCMFPRWLYVETKRNKAVQLLYREWDKERKKQKHKGPRFVLHVYGPKSSYGRSVPSDYIFFAIEDYLTYEPHENVWGIHVLRKNSAILNLFKDTEKKAKSEGRDVSVVAQKIHNRKGTFVFMRNLDRDISKVLVLCRDVLAKAKEGE